MRPLVSLLLLLLLGGLPGTRLSWASEPQVTSGPPRTRLYVMSSDSLFTTVNRNDAAASLKIWIEALGKRRGLAVDPKLDFFQSVDEVVLRLKSNSVDLLILDTLDYLGLADTRLVEPLAVGTIRGQVAAYPYLLLARGAGGITGLGDLRGKRIVVNSLTGAGMGLAWLETLLADSRLAAAEQYFGSVALTYKASLCVLPLYFGRIEACVVDSVSWDLLQELNPQLGRLKVLARSAPVVEGLVALPVSSRPHRVDLVESLMTLHQDPAGAQMALHFKTGPLIHADPAYFESARSIWGRYLRLRGGPGKAPAARAANDPAGKAPR